MPDLQTDLLGHPVTDDVPSEKEDEWIDSDIDVVEEEHPRGQPGKVSKSAVNEVRLPCL